MNRKLLFIALASLMLMLVASAFLSAIPATEVYAQDAATITPTPGSTETPAPTMPPPIPAGALTGTVIRASVLMARQQPYFSAGVVERVRRGETYHVIGRDPNAQWFLIQLYNGQGWVWGYYIHIDGNEFDAPVINPFNNYGAPANEASMVVQAIAGLKLRAEANVVSAQIGRVAWGDTLAVIGRSSVGSWYQVVYKGTVGWVYAPYTSIVEGSESDVPVIQVTPPPASANSGNFGAATPIPTILAVTTAP